MERHAELEATSYRERQDNHSSRDIINHTCLSDQSLVFSTVLRKKKCICNVASKLTSIKYGSHPGNAWINDRT